MGYGVFIAFRATGRFLALLSMMLQCSIKPHGSSMWVSTVVSAISAVLASGCGQGTASNQSQASPQLRLLGTLYGQYIAQHGGQTPTSEEQFKEFLEAQQIKIRNQPDNAVEALLRSPRDMEPLVIRYGSLTGPLSPNGYPWIAHEQTGLDGKIHVISARGEVEEFEQQELADLFPEDP